MAQQDDGADCARTEPAMAEPAATDGSPGRIIDCRCLSPGDLVEARYNGRLYYEGKVTETVPVLGMFWILETRTGTRKLLDPLAFHVIRLAAAEGTGPTR
ncbi:hypothetical protein [Arthrobacter globiformis]|uniref:hypothetical protein n=1 Tax=Arthrobacter globiformis TaxID=1665 RepID=UPI001CB92A04|nr:hypothetical protein [Arthrobacter globiformis]